MSTALPLRSQCNSLLGMELSARLKEIDAKCVCAHRVLNAIAVTEVTDPSFLSLGEEVRKAIADLTEARSMLTDLADEPSMN